MLAFELNRFIPVGSMQDGTLVLVESRDLGPLPGIQDTPSIDENVAGIVKVLVAVKITNFDIVCVAGGVPCGVDNLVVELAVASQAILLGEGIEIVKDFLATRICGGPVELRLKGPSVIVRGNIASATRPRLELHHPNCVNYLTLDTYSQTMFQPPRGFSHRS